MDAELQNPYSSFSGGWRMRAMLAKCILEQPDVLMLDEPTNHLDLPAIQWIEQYLTTFEGTIIVVSHDRHFLNRICNKIIEIENRRITTYTGNFEEYIEQKSEQGELIEKAYKNQQDKIRQEERFIERFKAKASKAKAAQSRMKLLEKVERIELPEGEAAAMNIKLQVSTQPGRRLYELKNVNKSFPHIELIKEAEAAIERGDKIALIGANGKGKSTILRILFGSEPFEGSRTVGHNVKTAFFAQHQLESLKAENNILDELSYSSTQKTEMELRAVLGAFLFTGDDVFKKIKVLSGGERSRVALAKIIISDANFLLLDEPTNHLDMQSVEILIQALQNYEGSYIAISHDRYFLSQIANKIWWIDEEKSMRNYGGTYDEYEVWRAAQQVTAKANKNTKNSGTQPPQVAAPKVAVAPQPAKSAGVPAPKINRFQLEKQLATAEAQIEALKQEKINIEAQLALPSIYADSKKSAEYAEKLRKNAVDYKKQAQEWEAIFLALEQ
jgi:ATP-binding cassette subfamily F protein 3